MLFIIYFILTNALTFVSPTCQQQFMCMCLQWNANTRCFECPCRAGTNSNSQTQKPTTQQNVRQSQAASGQNLFPNFHPGIFPGQTVKAVGMNTIQGVTPNPTTTKSPTVTFSQLAITSSQPFQSSQRMSTQATHKTTQVYTKPSTSTIPQKIITTAFPTIRTSRLLTTTVPTTQMTKSFTTQRPTTTRTSALSTKQSTVKPTSTMAPKIITTTIRTTRLPTTAIPTKLTTKRPTTQLRSLPASTTKPTSTIMAVTKGATNAPSKTSPLISTLQALTKMDTSSTIKSTLSTGVSKSPTKAATSSNPTTVAITPPTTITVKTTTINITTTNNMTTTIAPTTTLGGCPPFPSNCPQSCTTYDNNFCLACDYSLCSVTKGLPATGPTCPNLYCILPCNGKYKIDQNGCDKCECA